MASAAPACRKASLNFAACLTAHTRPPIVQNTMANRHTETEILQYTGKILQTRGLHGGDISQVTYLRCEKGDFVLKTNDKTISGMFPAEAEGLRFLAKYHLPVPEVVAVSDSYLLLLYYPPGKPDPANAGRHLARLHAHKIPNCGLPFDNFIGSLPQINSPTSSWTEFYIMRRLRPQLERLGCLSKSHPDFNFWSRLLNRLPTVAAEPEQFSLLHGDLWSGNLYYSVDGPLFIDPAPYAGDRLVEIAFTELFGRFDDRFYHAYYEVMPWNESYRELKKLYQLYPLLVHANLFGGSYYRSAREFAASYA